ncbi:unnamed protein product, partial [Sphacelaria rigidula]
HRPSESFWCSPSTRLVLTGDDRLFFSKTVLESRAFSLPRSIPRSARRFRNAAIRAVVKRLCISIRKRYKRPDKVTLYTPTHGAPKNTREDTHHSRASTSAPVLAQPPTRGSI